MHYDLSNGWELWSTDRHVVGGRVLLVLANALLVIRSGAVACEMAFLSYVYTTYLRGEKERAKCSLESKVVYVIHARV